MHLLFERGAVVVRDVPEDVDLAGIPNTYWNPALGVLRASMDRAPQIRAELARRGVPFADAVYRAADVSGSPLEPALEAWRAHDAEGAISRARSLDPFVAAAALTDLLDREIGAPTDDPVVLFAARLADQLRWAGAVPGLVRCLEHMRADDPLEEPVTDALATLGSCTDALLAALERCTDLDARRRLSFALAYVGDRDERVVAAIARLLPDDAREAAGDLDLLGDDRALPYLSRALDRLDPDRPGADEDAVALEDAILALDGKLTFDQEAKMCARLGFIPPAPREPARRVPRPGRNAPCHCGSGKKYKKCHLGVDG